VSDLRNKWRPLASMIIVIMWSVSLLVVFWLMLNGSEHSPALISYLSTTFVTFGLTVAVGVGSRGLEKIKGVQNND